MSKSDTDLGNIPLNKLFESSDDPFQSLNNLSMERCTSYSDIAELSKINENKNELSDQLLGKMTCPFILWKKIDDDFICEYANKKYKKLKKQMTLSDHINLNKIVYYNKYIDVINNKRNYSAKVNDEQIEIVYVSKNWFYEIHFHDSGNFYLSVINKKIKSPLDNIVKTIDQMDKNKSLTQGEKKNINVMKKACYELVNVANDIFDMMNLFNETVKIKEDKITLEQVLKKVNGMYECNKNIIFSIKYDVSIPKYLHICEKSLTKVMIKILDNSFQHTKKGSIEFDASLFTKELYIRSKCPYYYNDLKTCKKNRYNILFKIKDSGEGMNSHDKKILDNYLGIQCSDDYEMSKKYENFGFGLTICKQIVSYYKGNIWYVSYKDLGCVFYFNVICKCHD